MLSIKEEQWNSLKDYDNELSRVPHYAFHPEMIPFVGKHYPDARILLVGESHYLDLSDQERILDVAKWYTTPYKEYDFCYPENFNTREVIHNFLVGKRSKAHSMFRNPANALIAALDLYDVNDSEAFCAFAFMNYYQRPAIVYGESIENEETDDEIAHRNLCEVQAILNPVVTVFLSKKAFDSFIRHGGAENKKVEYVNHPTSSKWYNDNGKNKLIRILRESLNDLPKDKVFTVNQHLTIDEAMRILRFQLRDEDKFRVIEKNGRRFRYAGKITIQFYTDEKNEVNEIVWRLIDGDAKLGVGYVVKRRTLWLWRYSTPQGYLDQRDLLNYRELINLLQSLPIGSSLAVAGFKEYEKSNDEADRWFDANDPKAEAYDFLIEEVEDHIRVRETDGRKRAFLARCSKELRYSAIRSLAFLLNRIGFVAMDSNDVFDTMPSVVDYHLCEIAEEAYLHDLKHELQDVGIRLAKGKRAWVQVEANLENYLSMTVFENIIDKLEAAAGNHDIFMVNLMHAGGQEHPMVALWLPSAEL